MVEDSLKESEAPESGGSSSHNDSKSPEQQSPSTSGQGTMMSRISNPSVADNPQPDYLQALNSVKYIANNGLEELKIEDIFDGSSGSGVRNFQPNHIVNRPTHFTQEEEKTLE